ncbi:response regulator transcription factor [Siphonobacter aquaeclarae]|jgi:two-component system copper resistance phosphate regulon response regulator CusR|uniref:DNA-binding response regulator, OmpR family, contains REC and winged-helix (WHTH) domain n=1 Tax=Siphonobacter aquaeclarae TaxID=563176 RepID=A0A1G9N9Q7_9BACT|nr:response regulator transcription factor [Siphonobacter aquaeclarae]MBO9637664.1 response regulator transcription factor [Siphonobacter aquaeclarae]SDL82867.1 DNA-binding response regulator, OmpR family, contains REC and winged-helix (wHTH) domain [Siphonobacter aquaeclarae]
MKILIVEDEQEVASFIKSGLEDYGLEADIADDAFRAQQLLREQEYGTVILDINLPIMSGYELCKIIREKYEDLSILMLTALGTTENVLTGFDAGADDYLVKPFEFRELMARLRALNRRRLTVPSEAVILKIADLEFNQKSKTVKRGNQKINLTARELALLEFFIKNQNRALSRSEIAEKVWDVNFDTGTNVVDVYVNYLRKKIDKDFTPKVIHTISGIGYIMQEQED